MELGELISFLEKQNQEKVLKFGFGKPFSYRGWYDQLAFPPEEKKVKIDILIANLLVFCVVSLAGEPTIGLCFLLGGLLNLMVIG